MIDYKLLMNLLSKDGCTVIAGRPTMGHEEIVDMLIELNCDSPIISANLKRSIDARSGHKPEMEDFMLPEEILENSDTFIVVQKPAYYNDAVSEDIVIAQIICKKTDTYSEVTISKTPRYLLSDSRKNAEYFCGTDDSEYALIFHENGADFYEDGIKINSFTCSVDDKTHLRHMLQTLFMTQGVIGTDLYDVKDILNKCTLHTFSCISGRLDQLGEFKRFSNAENAVILAAVNRDISMKELNNLLSSVALYPPNARVIFRDELTSMVAPNTYKLYILE